MPDETPTTVNAVLETTTPPATVETKSGLKTTEFYLTLLAGFLTQVGALDLPGKYGNTIATVAVVVAYVISRGIAKSGTATPAPPSLDVAP